MLARCSSMSSDPEVTLRQGALSGTFRRSRNGRTFCAFQGIPYAKPPVGNLRFKPPQEPDSWTGMRAAKKEGPKCAQVDFITDEIGGEEDCLFINVFTPSVQSKGAGLTVLVWVHGGGFFAGSGDTELYGPDLLLDHDVVLVTFNYRLGIFGFLNLGTEDAPGNYGMKDQVAALRWVQRNISNFGGNPGSTESKQLTYFLPSVEPVGTKGAFLTEDPRVMLARGDIANVPIMAGCTTHESLMTLGMLQNKGSGNVEEFLNNPKNFMTGLFELKEGSIAYNNAWRNIKQFYEQLEPKNIEKRFLKTDVDFIIGVDELVRGVAALRRNPIFYYSFCYDGGLSLLKKVFNIQKEGAAHADELGYLFTRDMISDEIKSASPADLATIDRMTKLWVNFARTGCIKMDMVL
ncbi:hypothetical protein B566_EDAN014095 [Ephemera danica]|nr:hypothetical protein B566_EDAN014095 [Ephemera danica]